MMRIYENNVYIYIYIYITRIVYIYIYTYTCIHIIHAYIYMPHIITSTQDIWEWDNMGYPDWDFGLHERLERRDSNGFSNERKPGFDPSTVDGYDVDFKILKRM